MKKILLFIIIQLIAFNVYGQSDSVKISIERANKIESRLADCDLLQQQYNFLEIAEQNQQEKIASLQLIIIENEAKFKQSNDLFKKTEEKLNKKRQWNNVYKYSILVLIGALLIK